MMNRSLLLCIVAVTLLLPAPDTRAEGFDLGEIRRPIADLEPNFRESVIRGWKIFQTSFAADGVACVNCHLRHEEIVGWASGYPKVEVFDGTIYEVKTLRHVVLETLAIHTDLQPTARENYADDIAAYIAWWGDATRVDPGISRKDRPAAMDLEKLGEAAASGRSLFFDDGPSACRRCHTADDISDQTVYIPVDRTVTTYPRYSPEHGRVVSLDTFLTDHAGRKSGISGQTRITALAAYMAQLAQGSKMKPGSLSHSGVPGNRQGDQK